MRIFKGCEKAVITLYDVVTAFFFKQYNKKYDTNYAGVKAECGEIQENLDNIMKAVEKDIITESLIVRAEIEIKLSEIHQLSLIEYSDFSPIIDEFRGLKRNTESFRLC